MSFSSLCILEVTDDELNALQQTSLKHGVVINVLKSAGERYQEKSGRIKIVSPKNTLVSVVSRKAGADLTKFWLEASVYAS